jgi:adenylate cyclase
VRADVDWEAEGFLDGLPDERAREARRELLDELHGKGCSAEDLRQAVAEERLALVPLERLLGGEERYTARELEKKSGVPLDWLQASRRSLGLAVPDPDARVFGEDDLAAARIGRKVRDAGFQDEHVLDANRVLGRGMARYAEALRALSADVLLEPEADERELAHRFESVARELLPLAEEWLRHVFAMHFRQMLRHEAVTLQERTSGRSDERTQAIAFADLVGFTELGESVTVEELGDVASRLTRLAEEVTAPPVRLVKTIGDAVMLVAPDPKELVDAAVELVERGEAAEDMPKLRVGVAFGPAVNHWGDWFGSTVNLASRLTARARPGSVLAAEAVREAVGDGYTWSSAGPKKLKGFSSPVKTYRVRRPTGE